MISSVLIKLLAACNRHGPISAVVLQDSIGQYLRVTLKTDPRITLTVAVTVSSDRDGTDATAEPTIIWHLEPVKTVAGVEILPLSDVYTLNDDPDTTIPIIFTDELQLRSMIARALDDKNELIETLSLIPLTPVSIPPTPSNQGNPTPMTPASPPANPPVLVLPHRRGPHRVNPPTTA